MDLIGLRNYSGKYYHHENFSYLIELCGSSLSVISEVTGIPLTHLSRFKNGVDEIRIFDLVMIKGLVAMYDLRRWHLCIYAHTPAQSAPAPNNF